MHRTASNKLLWPVLEGLGYLGKDVRPLLEAAGLDEDRAFAPDARVDLEALYEIWRRAVEVTGEPALGVHLAAFLDPSANVSWPMPLSLLEHVGLVSATLQEAVGTQSRFLRLLSDGMRAGVEVEGERAIFRLEQSPEAPAPLTEHVFAMAVNLARRVLRRELPLIEVWFTHPAPPRVQAHAKLFKAPVRFSAPCNAVIARAEDFTARLPTANEMLRARIVRQAERLLDTLPSIVLFEDKVCAQIEAELPAGNTNASAVAEKLGVSSRTLHRRLQHEDASYQDLLDRVRLRLAVRHLAAGRPIAEVAMLVGFAQASTFHRAFKSWTGQTPADYQVRSRQQSVALSRQAWP